MTGLHVCTIYARPGRCTMPSSTERIKLRFEQRSAEFLQLLEDLRRMLDEEPAPVRKQRTFRITPM